MNIFAKSAAGLPLTPGQRAFLKLVKGFGLAALVTVAPVVAQLLASQHVDVMLTAKIAGGAFVVAFLMAMSKYYTAQGDAPLGTALAGVAGEVRQVAGIPNDLKIEPEVPATPVTLPSA